LQREAISKALSDGGFQSEITSSGEEAVALLQDDKNKYRALVTDIHLRGSSPRSVDAGWSRRTISTSFCTTI
jgi:CheY-like chemotaxis protein